MKLLLNTSSQLLLNSILLWTFSEDPEMLPSISVHYNLCCTRSSGLFSKPLRSCEGILLFSAVYELLPKPTAYFFFSKVFWGFQRDRSRAKLWTGFVETKRVHLYTVVLSNLTTEQTSWPELITHLDILKKVEKAKFGLVFTVSLY